MYNNSGINRAFLVGTIKNDAIWSVADGTFMLSFLLTTTEIFKKNGVDVEHNEDHNIAVPQKIAQMELASFLKGMLLSVEGKIQTSSRLDDSNIRRYRVEILVNKVQTLK